MDTARRPTRGIGLFQPARHQGSVTDQDDPLGSYLDEIAQTPLLTADEEVALAQAIERGEPAARDRLVRANLRLVVSIAKHYASQGMDLLDLVQEGNLGLMRATTRFDWRRGHRFATYASWWIRQAITKALTAQGRTIRLPARMNERVRKVNRTARELSQVLGRPPLVSEIADATGLRPRLVDQALQVATASTSLDEPVSGDEGDERVTVTPVASEPDPADQVIDHWQQAQLERAIDRLPPTQHQVVALRYGLVDGTWHTLADVGAQCGLSRESIRQIERQALARLRQSLDGADLTDTPPPGAGEWLSVSAD